MPCPYAEKKGPIVYCKLTGKKVNPLAFPCLTNKYTRCKYYRKAGEVKRDEEKAKAEEKPVTPQEAQKQALPQPPPSQPSISVNPPPTTSRRETKGMTIDGRKPSNCLECIYYGAKTRTCLLLGITVKDPYDPPCAKTQ